MTHPKRWVTLLLVSAATASFGATSLAYARAGKTATATVTVVDAYRHGRVLVTANGVKHRLRYGERTAAFKVSTRGRTDGVAVSSLKYAGCGEGDGGTYFNAHHKYRIRVVPMNRCNYGRGKQTASVGFKIHKIS